jgi:phage gp46-like protein
MDIELTYRTDSIPFDLSVTGSDLATDDGLKTAVVVSLFTDRRANPDDSLPDGTTDRRGWWADAYPDVADDRCGSRLWLLDRAKHTRETAAAAETYAEEALQWMVDDGVTSSVKASAEWRSTGVLALAIEIERPDGAKTDIKFDDLWEAMNAV